MSFRFRRTVRLFPGVRLNLSRSGASVSLGGPGLSVNLGPRGRSVTVGLPGTGLSYRHALSSPPQGRRSDDAVRRPPVDPVPREPASVPREATVSGEPVPAREGEIRSSDVAALTSPDFAGLKRMINEAAWQRADLEPDRAAALASRARAWRTLRRREQLPLRLVLKGRIPAARAAFEAAEDEALKVAVALAESEVRIDFQLGPEATAAYAALTRAHTALAHCARVWDVTTSVGIDRVRARSVASSAISRVPVALGPVDDSIVGSAQTGLRFGNANGGDLDLFPALLLMRARGGHDYALVDLRQLRLEVQPRAFVEDEAVPPDAIVIDHAWAKANRDGSPDRRFRDNRQIPVVRYGELRFSTLEGVTEAYHASNCEAALAFGQAFHDLQAALVRQAETGPVGVAEAAPIDRAVALPELPAVRGAHEVTVFGLAALCAPLVLWHPTLAPTATAPSPLASSDAPRSAHAEDRPAPVSAARDAPERSGISDSPARIIARSEPATDPTLPVASVPTRVVTLRAANLRERPDATGRVLRVLDPATRWTVFDRQGAWVQVGEGTSTGWVHSTLVRTVP